MDDPAYEHGGFGKFFIAMDRFQVAVEAGDADHVGLGYGFCELEAYVRFQILEIVAVDAPTHLFPSLEWAAPSRSIPCRSGTGLRKPALNAASSMTIAGRGAHVGIVIDFLA